MQPYCPELAAMTLDFIGVAQGERTLNYAQITAESMKRTITFEVEKKSEIFVEKIETEEERQARL